ncbi:hypothetical protein FOA52_015428 [Chlamydomonas sp. UWO 241]|nr:hypothetical protein FOA52_015428 [Chlamydomonas sp. UWO 241]
MSFDWEWDIVPTLEFIRGRGFASAALQFPDELLGAATNVAAALQGRLGPACKLYVLADTAYNPLAVDEVAAQHANAQCVIHYGPASLSPVNTLPAFFVFPKARLPDPSSAAAQISAALASSKDLSSKPAVVLLLDQAYAHGGAGDVLARAVRGAAAAAAAAARSGPESPDAPMPQTVLSIIIKPVNASPQVVVVARPAALQLAYGSHAWLVCEPGRGGGGADGGGDAGGAAGGGGAATAASAAGVDAGDGADRGSEQAAHSSPPLVLSSAAGGGTAPTAGGGGGDAEDQEQATATHASSSPPASPPLVLSEGMSPATRALLRRRYFLVEKAKGASIVGILAGTLACAGFTDAIAMVRRLAHAAGKKTYTLVMGKPNPAKLANFPEIDVFVMVADPLGFILDCKEYLAPIISPHEARLAFTDQSLDPSARYPLDFNEVLRADAEKAEGGRCAAPGGGAASGAGRGSGDDDNDDSGGDGELVAIGGLSLAAHASIGGGGGRGAVAARDAAQYLATRREYTGLVTPLVGGEVLAPVLVVEGRSGRAAVYEDEPSEK